jgi:hypothetical protein
VCLKNIRFVRIGRWIMRIHSGHWAFLAVLTVVLPLIALAQDRSKGQALSEQSNLREVLSPLKSPPLGTVLNKPRILASYGNLPLAFESNEGQTDPHVKFLSRTGGYTLFLSPDEMLLKFRSASDDAAAGKMPKSASDLVGSSNARLRARSQGKSRAVRIRFLGGNASSNPEPLEQLSTKSNYFIGNNPKSWRTNVRNYAAVRYVGVYPGIDVIYRGNQRKLQFDFEVAPGADPGKIRLAYDGAEKVGLNEQGDLVLKAAGSELMQRAPIVYQEINGERRAIQAQYVLNKHRTVGIQVSSYDPSQPLTIDPTVVYATYLGGSGSDAPSDIVVDAEGNVYVAGYTESNDFPRANLPKVSPLKSTITGTRAAFVSKMDSTLSNVIYSTYIESTPGPTYGAVCTGLAVDGNGNAYVAGWTDSDDFPTTLGSFQPISPGGGGHFGFISKLSADGSALLYSTYLGGTGGVVEGTRITVDTAGQAYVTGVVFPPFPTVNPIQGAFGGGYDAFVTKFNAVWLFPRLFHVSRGK